MFFVFCKKVVFIGIKCNMHFNIQVHNIMEVSILNLG